MQENYTEHLGPCDWSGFHKINRIYNLPKPISNTNKYQLEGHYLSRLSFPTCSAYVSAYLLYLLPACLSSLACCISLGVPSPLTINYALSYKGK